MITAHILEKSKTVVITIRGKGRMDTLKRLEALAASKGYDVVIKVCSSVQPVIQPSLNTVVH